MILIAIVQRKLSSEFNLLIGAVHCNTRKGCYNLSAIYMAPNKEKNSKETWHRREVSCSSGVFLKSPTSKFQFRVYLLAKKGLYRWDLQRSPTGIRIHSSYCVNKCFFLQMGSKLLSLTPRTVCCLQTLQNTVPVTQSRYCS